MGNRRIGGPRRSREISRRDALRRGFLGLGMFAVGPTLYGCGGRGPSPTRRVSNLADVGELGAADANGLRLPAGFTGRVVARTGEAPSSADAGFLWHAWPDGGATFATENDGWIYVSNSELRGPGLGGVGALRFDRNGDVVSAYPILAGTNTNCAGGATPWGTWLSCEEFGGGQVWECDPTGRDPAVVRPALGTFSHEAVAVDPDTDHLFLTEDVPDGGLYRYVPANAGNGEIPDLDDGRLEIALVLGEGEEGPIEWKPVPDPTMSGGTPTRRQVGEYTGFLGGEGIWYSNRVMYFTTKFDNRVWAYDIDAAEVSIVYDLATSDTPILSGVDNITVSEQGDLLVAEDGGDMQIVAIVPTGEIVPIVMIEGHGGSEVTGPAFDPSGTRLYFSSQRAPGFSPSGGITYEVSGPFFVQRLPCDPLGSIVCDPLIPE